MILGIYVNEWYLPSVVIRHAEFRQADKPFAQSSHTSTISVYMANSAINCLVSGSPLNCVI